MLSNSKSYKSQNYLVLLTNFILKHNIVLARCINNDENFTTAINLSDVPVKITKGTILGLATIVKENRNEVVNLCEEQVKDLETNDTFKNSRKNIQALLLEFKDIIALSNKDLSTTDIIEHSISTIGEIDQPPYFKHSKKENEIISNEVKELLDHDLIELSDARIAFPSILVKKKTGEWRFCIDYRKLNKVTIKDNYQMPRVDETLDYL